MVEGGPVSRGVGVPRVEGGPVSWGVGVPRSKADGFLDYNYPEDLVGDYSDSSSCP